MLTSMLVLTSHLSLNLVPEDGNPDSATLPRHVQPWAPTCYDSTNCFFFGFCNLYVCVWYIHVCGIYIWVCVYVHMCVQVHMCIETRNQCLVSYSTAPHLTFWDRVSESGTNLARLGRPATVWNLLCLPLQHWSCRQCHHTALIWALKSELRTYAYVASILPAEPSILKAPYFIRDAHK